MTGKNESYLSTKEEIDILLKEYDTLRTEIINRISNGFQLGAIAIAAITWLASRAQNQRSLWLACAIGGGIILFSAILWRDLFLTSRRVAELETEINVRAGKTLLKWESVLSPGSRGLFGWLGGWTAARKKRNR